MEFLAFPYVLVYHRCGTDLGSKHADGLCLYVSFYSSGKKKKGMKEGMLKKNRNLQKNSKCWKSMSFLVTFYSFLSLLQTRKNCSLRRYKTLLRIVKQQELKLQFKVLLYSHFVKDLPYLISIFMFSHIYLQYHTQSNSHKEHCTIIILTNAN